MTHDQEIAVAALEACDVTVEPTGLRTVAGEDCFRVSPNYGRSWVVGIRDTGRARLIDEAENQAAWLEERGCERCGFDPKVHPKDRDNDPAREYAEEKCVGEGGHFYAIENDWRGLPHQGGYPVKGRAENFDVTGTGLAARAEIRAARRG